MCPLTKIVEYIVDNQDPEETIQSVKPGIKTYDLFVGKWRETDEKLKKLLKENIQASVGPEAELIFENFNKLATQSFQPIPTDAKYRNLIIRYPDDHDSNNDDDDKKFRKRTKILLNWIIKVRNYLTTQSIMY